MLLSLALIIICGLVFGSLIKKIKLPSLLSMLLVGIVLGPYVLDLIAPEILAISTELRQIALIIILLLAGLALDTKSLKKVGRPAILLSFIPALVEITATTIFAPLLFGISYLEAIIMGTVLGAVSPAVVVPRMLKLTESGHGVDKGIPQLLMASASVDDIFVIVLFTSFMSAYTMNKFSFLNIAKIPISIITGLVLGIAVGVMLTFVFKKIKIRATIKTLIVLAVSILFVVLEETISAYIPLSGLLGVVALGGTILKLQPVTASKLSLKYNKIWIFAEILLFVLVGATVDIQYALKASGLALALIFIALTFRFLSVLICLIKTPLNMKERIFCAISYLPKATVQAAIGALPLAAGVGAGSLILTVAVLSILVTAPLGAFGIDLTYKKLLSTSSVSVQNDETPCHLET